MTEIVPFGDRLTAAIKAKGTPICVGLDPEVGKLPNYPRLEGKLPKLQCVGRIWQFCAAVIDTVADLVPVVKINSAFFERYHWQGVQVYYQMIHYAKNKGLLVIGDVKRGDIGNTAAAYADGHLDLIGTYESIATPDAITVNPMMGLDTLEPFCKEAVEHGKGLFVLVRTSNPGSDVLQKRELTREPFHDSVGDTWSINLASKLRGLQHPISVHGESGFSSLGAVIGANHPEEMACFRRILPNSIFLLPGYGAQGATAEMTRAAFVNGQGAIVSASRSIIYAHREEKYAHLMTKPDDWTKCVRQAVLDMKDELNKVINQGTP